mmetsp:Transcript_43504/g.130494  ORF Transcript_43504/g.130494 Transcript_43504/m.130494 type:complete len:203 (-) Transcript_43504:260-868(-)
MLERHHLVQAAPQAPHVAFEVVRLAAHHLWAHVVWRADDGLCEVEAAGQRTADAKVAQLDAPVLGQEDVCRLQVPVEDALAMHVLKRHQDLGEQLQDLPLQQRRLPRPQQLRQVASLAVLCHDAQVASVEEVVHIAQDQWVVERAQHLHLCLRLNALFFVRLIELDLLQHEQLVGVGCGGHQVCRPVRPHANSLDHLVFIHG